MQRFKSASPAERFLSILTAARTILPATPPSFSIGASDFPRGSSRTAEPCNRNGMIHAIISPPPSRSMLLDLTKPFCLIPAPAASPLEPRAAKSLAAFGPSGGVVTEVRRRDNGAKQSSGSRGSSVKLGEHLLFGTPDH